MKNNKIVVVGSSNTDMVIQSDKLPLPGETVLGGQFIMNPGGKGANQAVAAARLGGDVSFICRVGNDVLGNQAIDNFIQEGIDTSYITKDETHPTGTALIMVNKHGENSISVALGANAQLDKAQLNHATSIIGESAYILAQLETPIDTIEYLGQLAKERNVPMILNPAPAHQLSPELLESLYIISPNAIEAELLTGIPVHDISSARSAAIALRNKGVDIVIITLGAQGAYILSQDIDELVPAPEASVRDTTAAGDTFNGALVVALAECMSLIDAVKFANQAAAISVSRIGAQSSVPYRSEVTI